VPAAPSLPVDVSGQRGTVAVRVPGMPLPRRLAAALGRPITGVSANLHASPPCRTARDVADQFPTGLDVILDGGPSPGGQPSTILDLTGSQPTILRHGLLPASALEPFLSDLEKRPL
jgi:L-threonylcarbamoyladenylate synthase